MANDKPFLHLPLDEIRVTEDVAKAPNVGGIAGDAIVRGNPAILHDPEMGTCMRFDGQDDYIELTDLSALTFTQGITVMAWVRFEDTPFYGRIFDLNVARNQKASIVWAGNEDRSRHLAFEINGERFRIDNRVDVGQWRHYAFVQEPSGKTSILINGAVVFSKEAAFAIANVPWKTGYVGKSSYDADSPFRGAMAHFRIYNQPLARADVMDLMIGDQSAMACYRETTLLKVDLYTVRDDDHKPILYVEADNKGEPLEVSLTNPGDKPVMFKSFSAPSADEFHVQLRFRRNVIAPGALRALQSSADVVIDGWQYAAGTSADGREDYISFLKTDNSPTLDKGQSWRIRIPNFSAAAQGGARNTRIQVRYRTEPQDPGSVIRHMEVQSHLGLKTIPLIARFRGSNTILNNGTTANKLAIEVVCLNETGSVRLDENSKFEVIVDNELLQNVENHQVKSTSTLEAASQTNWLEALTVQEGIGDKAISFSVKTPASAETDGATAAAARMEVTRSQPLTFELRQWVTNRPSGTYNILLRYENIPGYWDGAWVLPVEFSSLVLSQDKIGIGTDDPKAALHVIGDTRIDGNLNVGGSADGAINVRHINGKSDQSTEPDVLQLNYDNEKNVEVGSANKAANLVVHGRVTDRTGDVMPVGAIIAYAGGNAPDGWLLCKGQLVSSDQYRELHHIIGKAYGGDDRYFKIPNLCGRVIVGVGQSDRDFSPLGATDGHSAITLSADDMPPHSHTGTTNQDGEHNHAMGFRGFDTEGGNDNEDGANESDDPNNKIHTRWGGAHTHYFTTSSVGKGQAHDNLQPYIVLNYIIKY
ncbi:MAG: LamG-like jellyroll fold domain-containing protein [Blastocatellia bacterium]|nr:LamG-like jellyroll fold domain-containing protein [Blastocatellia bacterium]